MTQYPPPYQPVSHDPFHYGWDPYFQLLQPAKRASILMFVLGGLGAACGACFGVMVNFIPWNRLPPEMMRAMREMEAEIGIPAQSVFVVLAMMFALPSVLLLLLGFFVRRGGAGAVYTSIVFVGLIIAAMLLNLVSGVSTMLGSPATPSGAMPGLCMAGVVTGAFVLLMVWLIQAARNTRAIRDLQIQYQTQYWQHMAQYRQYAQPTGGQYAPQPPPPPTATPGQ